MKTYPTPKQARRKWEREFYLQQCAKKPDSPKRYGKKRRSKRYSHTPSVSVAKSILPPIPSNIRMRFWACVDCPGGCVSWKGSTATCSECGKTNKND